MRSFERADPPPGWPENQEKWNQQWIALLQANPNAVFSWYRHETKSARDIALPHLKEQTQEHCSFCDGFPVEGISLETIEHFRPKCAGRFPEHAYSWENLYYCCDQCQSHKREQWDDRLLAPDTAGYVFDRYFEFDFTTGEMCPFTAASEEDKARAATTIRMYGLDSQARRRLRRLELRKWTRTTAEGRNVDDFAYRSYLVPTQ